MNLAVVFSKKKNRYGPIATSIIAASRKLDFSIRLQGDDLRGFKNIIFFDNKLNRLQQKITCDLDAKVGWWMCDYRPVKDFKVEGKIASEFTNIFLCSTQLIPEYKKQFNLPVHYMPQCGHSFEDSSVRRHFKNIVFIGSVVHPKYHINRLEYLIALKRFGLSHIYKDRTSYDMSDIYSKVPISLSISMPFRGYTSNRLYNILAAGGFAFSLYYPEMELQFENKKHLVWFNSEQEAKELATYYLNKPKERAKIARAGANLFWEKHTAEHRIKNMIDIMEGRTEKYYGYLKE